MARISILNLETAVTVDNFCSSVQHGSLLRNLTSGERRVRESHASEQLPKSGLKNIKSTKLLNMV